MRRLGLLAGVLGLLDAGVIMAPVPLDEGVGRVAVVAPAAVGPSMEVTADWLGTVLSRPLFTVGRRAAVEAVVERPVVPRLTGIVVAGSVRRAVFAGPGFVLDEGERVGLFRVTSIRVGAVELDGPGGPRTVYPTGDAEVRAELAAARPLLALISPGQRELETETDQ